MNSNSIEQIAVAHLTMKIAICEHLKADINQNDKTLSWDGHVEVYGSTGNKKADFVGRCPVQVKGKSVSNNELRKQNISYSVDVDDLRNYLNDGGVIYFVIGISATDKEQCRIYYSVLLPFDINQILNNLKDKQKTRSVQLSSFPPKQEQIEEIFRYFLVHKHHQFGKPFLNGIDIIKNDGETSYSILAKSPMHFLDGTPKYVYKNLPDNVFIPVEKIMPIEIELKNAPVDVSVDDQRFFQDVKLTFAKGNVLKKLELNKGLFIKVNSKGNMANVKVTKNCTVAQYIKNLEFLIALAEGKILKLGNLAIGSNPKMNDEVSVLEGELNFYKKVAQLFERLNIKKRLVVREFSNDMCKKIDFLFGAIIEEKSFEDKNAEPAMGGFEIGRIRCFILRIKKNNNEVGYINPFENNNAKCEMAIAGDNERFSASLFVTFNKEDFLKYDNIDYVAMAESIKSVEYSEDYGTAVDYFILNLLSAYDKRKSAEMLDCAIEVSSWLCKQSPNVVRYLNKMQSIFRKRPLSDEESEIILNIRDDSVNSWEILTGCAILLHEKHTYKHCLEKLPRGRKKEFLKYPISHLMK